MPSLSSEVEIYPLANYDFDQNQPPTKDDSSTPATLKRLQIEHSFKNPRLSLEVVLLVHQNRLPHVLLFETSLNEYHLPNIELNCDESEFEGLNRCLKKYFGENANLQTEWEFVEKVANWWRPNFEPNQYPYIPAHITDPKEYKQIFLIKMPPKARFSIPGNLKLVALSFLEIYNEKHYGNIIASLPQVLCRFSFNLLPS